MDAQVHETQTVNIARPVEDVTGECGCTGKGQESREGHRKQGTAKCETGRNTKKRKKKTTEAEVEVQVQLKMSTAMLQQEHLGAEREARAIVKVMGDTLTVVFT